MNQQTHCRKCGVSGLFWRVSKKGAKYLAEQQFVNVENGTKWIYPAHKCHPDDLAHAEANLKFIDDVVADNLRDRFGIDFRKGDFVQVVKGRKITRGTVARVFWIADKPDAYGTIRVGLETENGDKQFTAATNLQLLPEGKNHK